MILDNLEYELNTENYWIENNHIHYEKIESHCFCFDWERSTRRKLIIDRHVSIWFDSNNSSLIVIFYNEHSWTLIKFDLIDLIIWIWVLFNYKWRLKILISYLYQLRIQF